MHPGVFVRSVYFQDPDGILLELAAWTKVLDESDVRHAPVASTPRSDRHHRIEGGLMGRLRQVARSETDDPIVNGMYDLLFGKGVDPVAEQKMGHRHRQRGRLVDHLRGCRPTSWSTPSPGSILYRSPDRKLDGVLRELAQSRIGWAVGEQVRVLPARPGAPWPQGRPRQDRRHHRAQDLRRVHARRARGARVRRRHRLRQRAGQRRPLRGAPGGAVRRGDLRAHLCQRDATSSTR